MAPRLFLGVALIGMTLTAPLLAEDAGQKHLDDALTAKLSAEGLLDLGNVIDHARKAIKAGLSESNEKLARQLLASSLLQRGTLLAGNVLHTAPTNIDQLRQLVRLRELAQSDLEEAVEVMPSSAKAHFLLGRLQALPGGDEKQAVKHLSQAEKLAGAKDDIEQQGKALAARGALQKDPKQALADFNAAVKLLPGDAEAVRARAEFYLENDETEKGLADLETAIKLDRQHSRTHEIRGTALAMLKRYDEARQSLDKAVELEPRSITAYIQRGRVLLLQGEYQLAEEDFTKVIGVQPIPQILLLRASALQMQKKDKQALADVEAALKLQPGMPEALRARAMLQAGSGNIAAAIGDLEQLKEIETQDSDVLLQLGMLYYANGQLTRSVEAFTTLIEQQPKHPQAHRARADAYLMLGKHAQAVADYDQALKTAPEDTHILNNLAWVLATSPDAEVRNGKRAIELARQGCELTDYKQAHIVSTLASGYAELGDFDNAVKWSEKAVALGEGEIKDHLQKELESYKAGKPWRERQTPEEEDSEKEPKENSVPAP